MDTAHDAVRDHRNQIRPLRTGPRPTPDAATASKASKNTNLRRRTRFSTSDIEAALVLSAFEFVGKMYLPSTASNPFVSRKIAPTLAPRTDLISILLLQPRLVLSPAENAPQVSPGAEAISRFKTEAVRRCPYCARPPKAPGSRMKRTATMQGVSLR
jgi:hypothetical protein